MFVWPQGILLRFILRRRPITRLKTLYKDIYSGNLKRCSFHMSHRQKYISFHNGKVSIVKGKPTFTGMLPFRVL